MPNDQMFECEQRKEFRRPEGDVWQWTVVAVEQALEVPRDRLRCRHCHGAIRLHGRNVPHGPRPHAEHRLKQDSEHCPGGIYFAGEARLSTQPIE